MSKKYVPDGVWLTCSKGTCMSQFKITFHERTTIYGSNFATEGDRWPFVNIKPMGQCMMTGYPCIPSPVIWQKVKEGVYINRNRMLLEDSQAQCLCGGKISIHFTKEAAMAAAPWGSFKKPSEYIKDFFDWSMKGLAEGDASIKSSLTRLGAPAWIMKGYEDLSWAVQMEVGVAEGVINAVVGTGELIWDISQDPVGIGEAVISGVSGAVVDGWNWAKKGENWTNAAKDGWDWASDGKNWKQAGDDASDWVKKNPRKIGNMAGEVLETAAEIALTVGTATLAKGAAKGTQEIVEAGVRKGLQEITEEGTEKAVKELVEEGAEKATKELAEKAAKETGEKAVKEVAEETGEKAGKRAVVKTNNKFKQFFEDAKKKFDPKKATKQQKGNFGEMASADNMTNNPALKKQGYDLERIGKDAPTGLDDKIDKGIDGIYKNKGNPPPKYVIDEAKYNSSTLNQKPIDGPQMSDKWIKERVENQYKKGNLTKVQKDDILDAMKNGEVDKVVSHVDEAGNVKTYKVDVNTNGKTSYGKTSWP